MATTDTIAIEAQRHEMADEALGEISEVASALLHLIERHDTAGRVTRLSRGMLTRVKALSNIAAECLEPSPDGRRQHAEIAAELRGRPERGPAACTRGTTAPHERQLQGGIAFYEMLRAINAVPDHLRPGKAPDDPDSTTYGLHVAQRLMLDAMLRSGLQVTDAERAQGFAACLARHVMSDLKGYSLGYSDSAENDAREALAEVDEARLGMPLEVEGSTTG